MRRRIVLSAAETARVLGVSLANVHAWRRAGTGPNAERVGGRYVWRVAEIRKWVRVHMRAVLADCERELAAITEDDDAANA